MRSIYAAPLILSVLVGCADRDNYYTAIDNQGRYSTERQQQIITARLALFNAAMEAAGKTESPLDDVLVYTRYDQSMIVMAQKTQAPPEIKPPADVPEYIRAVGQVAAPYVPWLGMAWTVGKSYETITSISGPRYETGGGALNINESYNKQALSAAGDGALTGSPHTSTDSHNAAQEDPK